jgi:3-oxoacyl-[acyl-carrier-protein] synthase III
MAGMRHGDSRMTRTAILGTGAYAPEKVLTNADLEKMVATSDAWITARTGIKERRIAAPGEVTSDMAVKAAIRALEMARTRADELDMIIVGTISADMPMPSCAVMVQAKLGRRRRSLSTCRRRAPARCTACPSPTSSSETAARAGCWSSGRSC